MSLFFKPVFHGTATLTASRHTQWFRQAAPPQAAPPPQRTLQSLQKLQYLLSYCVVGFSFSTMMEAKSVLWSIAPSFQAFILLTMAHLSSGANENPSGIIISEVNAISKMYICKILYQLSHDTHVRYWSQKFILSQLSHVTPW